MTANDALEAHRIVMEYERAKGNRPLAGIINPDGLESAVAQPYHGHHRPIHKKGAVLVDAIVRNHPFVDGNKRAAMSVLVLLLDRSGFEFVESSETFQVELGQKIEALAARILTRSDFDLWLAGKIQVS